MVGKVVRLLLIVAILGLPIQGNKASEETKIVEAYHFFSKEVQEKSYDSSTIQIGKPIVVMIQDVESDLVYDNKILVELVQGDEKQVCEFQSFQDLCVIEKAKASTLKLNFKCKQLPCQIQWDISQPQIGNIKNPSKISKLYKIKESSNHMIIAFSCSMLQDEAYFNNQVDLYSTNKFVRYESENNIHFLFNSLKTGFIFLKIASKVKSCIQIKYNNVPTDIGAETITDFILKDSSTSYSIPNIPSKDFRFECEVRPVPDYSVEDEEEEEDNFQVDDEDSDAEPQKEGKIEFIVSGQKQGKRQEIRKSQIKFSRYRKNKEFNVVIPKIQASYTNIKLEISSVYSILIDLLLFKDEVQIISTTQFSYFDLKKSEIIKYQLPPEPNAEPSDTANIYPSNPQSIKVSETKCQVVKGCKFQIQAVEDIRGQIYVGDTDLAKNEEGLEEVLVYDFGEKNSFTKKIHEGQKIFIKKKLTGKAIQVVVNTENVVIYAANVKRCKFPSQFCYQKIGSLHDPFIYEPKDSEVIMMFSIKGLDIAEFTMTIIEAGNKYIELTDGEPFSYSFDNMENDLGFLFKNPKKETVSFNLIGPLNELILLVRNSQEGSDEEKQQMSSTEGFLLFEDKQIQNEMFSIMVKRRDLQDNSDIHFTLIASTKTTYIRLEPGVTHYQTLRVKDLVRYIFEFNINEDYIINFYTHNIKTQQVNVGLEVSAKEIQEKQKGQIYTINKESDVLPLTEVSEELCQGEGQSAKNCQIFIELRNHMEIEIDIAITLMTRHSLIELQEGIWQTFSLNSVAESSHFYFMPEHKDQSINIIYKSTEFDLRLSYKIFNTLYGKILPGEWPFPPEKPTDDHEGRHSLFKPVKNIIIGTDQLEQCWPSCVVLMSLLSFSHQDIDGQFVIMATNDILELPENEKIDIVLKEEESKSFLIDLKYALQKKEDIIIYVAASIGMVEMHANVYSDKNQRIPIPDEADFQFDEEETIELKDIEEILDKNGMSDDNNKYLYLTAIGYTDTKVSLQYNLISSDDKKLVKKLSYDSFETVSLESGEARIYHLKGDQEFQIKVLRLRGFPFLKVKVCHQKNLEECLAELQQDTDKGKQIITKTEIIKEQPCLQCIILTRVSTLSDPSQLQLHIQSKYSDIELSEGQTIVDFTVGSQANRYTIYAVKGEEVVININVNEGEIMAQLTDLAHLQKKQSSDEIITFVVSPSYYEEEEEQLKKAKQQYNDLIKETGKLKIDEIEDGKTKDRLKQLYELQHSLNGANINSLAEFGNQGKFIVLHVTISSTNQKIGSQYIISYTSGSRDLELQDGLMVDTILEPLKPQTYQYLPMQKGHAFLLISPETTEALSNIQIKMESCDLEKVKSLDDYDTCWKEFPPNIPTVKRKTPNPVIISSLPDQSDFKFTFLNKGTQNISISIGINHQQVILLPYEVQFPFLLHPKQYINFLVNVKNPGHFLMVIRKCDESQPIFSYTFDFKELDSNDFTNELSLDDDPKYDIKTKTDSPGVLYLHISSEFLALMSVQVFYSEDKITANQIKPGSNGRIDYLIKDSDTATLTISKPHCPTDCGQIKYVLMVAETMQDLYSQLVCPTNFFANTDTVNIPAIPQKEIVPTENKDGTLSFDFDLLADICYMGIKIETSTGAEAYYKPIEVVTIWGQFNRTSTGLKLTISTVLIVALLGIILLVRTNARKGYKRISEEMD